MEDDFPGNSSVPGVHRCYVHAQSFPSCLTLCDPMDCSLLVFSGPLNSPGKNTGVGFRGLLQGIFPTLGLNPCLLCLPALPGEFFFVCFLIYLFILIGG